MRERLSVACVPDQVRLGQGFRGVIGVEKERARAALKAAEMLGVCLSQVFLGKRLRAASSASPKVKEQK